MEVTVDTLGDAMAATDRPFESVSDRDLVTLANLACRSLEYRTMLAGLKLMQECDRRGIWPQVEELRADILGRIDSTLTPEEAAAKARRELATYRDQHFPVEPESDAGFEAERSAWNGYLMR